VVSLVGASVVIDGRQFNELSPGRKDAWRTGVIVRDDNPYVAVVDLAPVGRQRKPQRVTYSKSGLLKDTPELQEAIRKWHARGGWST
jgi:hypothetical protein